MKSLYHAQRLIRRQILKLEKKGDRMNLKDFILFNCRYKENKVLYKIEQKDNLLDSSAIAMSNWIEIAQDISVSHL